MNVLERTKKWFCSGSKSKRKDIVATQANTCPMESDKACEPNFFIVGAAKSGTTSLWQYLRQHPDIFMPSDIAWKEPSYYCETYGIEDYALYLSLFKEAGTQKKIGEASTAYLSSPESAGRIRKAVPDAKIIIMLRNPVDRAYSLYKWMHRYGYEKLTPFEAALNAEVQSRKDNETFVKEYSRKGGPAYYRDFLYFSSGLYYEQVKLYYSLFPASQVTVIILEEFAERTLESVRNIYRFLDVDPNFTPEIKIHNEGAPGYENLSEKLRLDLERRYLPDVTNLSALLNKDLKPLWF